MADDETSPSTTEAPPEPAVRRATAAQKKPKTRRQPPYSVVLHNDDINGFDFVVGVLRKVFRYAEPQAHLLTLEAHKSGRSIVWTGALEVAEFKADQVRSCGPDPNMKSRGATSLGVTVEPAPE